MRKANAWVFDLDDTVRPNVHDYAYPILDSCRLIIDTLGNAAPHVSAIIALEQEIDSRRVKEVNPITGQPYGYSMERFPGSLVEVYREICRRAGKSPSNWIERDLWHIGLQAFDSARYKEDSLCPDTIPTLNFLRSKGDQILLLTKGDKRIQGRKLLAFDAGKRFIKVKIVDDKTPEVFKEMIRGFEDYRSISVGDNYDSDIVPALNAGYHRGVWIPKETWTVIGRLDEIHAKVDRSRCIELHSLKELVERYDEIEKGGAA